MRSGNNADQKVKTMNQHLDPVVIVSAVRTPMGGFLGDLAGLSAAELGAAAIRSSLERAGLAAEAVDTVLMGCVLQAGQGQAPARQAALGAGLSQAAQCTTLNKMCGSGMQALMLGHDQLLAGSADVLVAGGMESMSNAPYLLARAAAATAWAMVRCSTICSSTAWRTPTSVAG